MNIKIFKLQVLITTSTIIAAGFIVTHAHHHKLVFKLMLVVANV